MLSPGLAGLRLRPKEHVTSWLALGFVHGNRQTTPPLRGAAARRSKSANCRRPAGGGRSPRFRDNYEPAARRWQSVAGTDSGVGRIPKSFRSCVAERRGAARPALDTHFSVVVRRGREGGQFPLTPALSPRERETFRPRWFDSFILDVRSPCSSAHPKGGPGRRSTRMVGNQTMVRSHSLLQSAYNEQAAARRSRESLTPSTQHRNLTCLQRASPVKDSKDRRFRRSVWRCGSRRWCWEGSSCV